MSKKNKSAKGTKLPMGINAAKGLIDDIRSKKLKRKKVCKKKNYKNLLEALDVLSRELEISLKLNDMYKGKMDELIKQNGILIADLADNGEMLRNYQRRMNPNGYPEETKEEIETLEDLNDDDISREDYEEAMKEMLGENYLSASDTIAMFKDKHPEDDPIPNEEDETEDTSNE